MEGYIDIHCHILPGIDDGPKNMDQTLEMIRLAYKEGIRTIIVTPHFHETYFKNSFEKIEESLKGVQEVLGNFSIDMNLFIGCELYYGQHLIELLNENLIPTMAGSKYVLVEFSTLDDHRNITNGLKNLLMEGYVPILAHVERYQDLTKDLNRVVELIESGVYIQVNARSVTGENGRHPHGITRKLLKNNMVHFVATDAHNDSGRSPSLDKCAKYIEKKYGINYAKELLIENPKKIIFNEYI